MNKKSLLEKRERLETEYELLKKQMEEVSEEMRRVDHLLDDYDDEEEKLPPPKPLIEHFYVLLKEAYLAHLEDKNTRFFIPLFRRHPKVIMSEKLNQAVIEAKKIRKDLPELEPFFSDFQNEMEKSWNQDLYKYKVADLFHKLQKHVGDQIY